MKWLLLVLVVFSFLVAPAAAGPFVDRVTVYVQPAAVAVQPVGPGFVHVQPPAAVQYQPLYFYSRPPMNPIYWVQPPIQPLYWDAPDWRRPRRTVVRYVYP